MTASEHDSENRSDESRGRGRPRGRRPDDERRPPHDERRDTRTDDEPDTRTVSGERHRRVKPAVAIRTACEQLEDSLGRRPESVSALQRAEDGWIADVEVVELERVPDSTSIMASYRVQLDADGELIGYERRARYPRSQIDRG